MAVTKRSTTTGIPSSSATRELSGTPKIPPSAHPELLLRDAPSAHSVEIFGWHFLWHASLHPKEINN